MFLQQSMSDKNCLDRKNLKSISIRKIQLSSNKLKIPLSIDWVLSQSSQLNSNGMIVDVYF